MNDHLRFNTFRRVMAAARLLSGKRYYSAREIAEHVGCGLRHGRRYVDALELAGIPVERAGEGIGGAGVRYRINPETIISFFGGRRL